MTRIRLLSLKRLSFLLFLLCLSFLNNFWREFFSQQDYRVITLNSTNPIFERKPRFKVMFLKNHKVASSTVASILLQIATHYRLYGVTYPSYKEFIPQQILSQSEVLSQKEVLFSLPQPRILVLKIECLGSKYKPCSHYFSL